MMSPGFWTLFWIGHYAVAALGVLDVLRRPREPRAMVAWILALLLLPLLGIFLYVVIGEPRLRRTRKKRRRRFQKLTPTLEPRTRALRDTHALPCHDDLDPGLLDLVKLATRLTRHPLTCGNEVTIYHDAEKTFLALQMAVKAATSHVHIQYYILQPDDTGRAVADLLMARAREGIKCRLLLDYVGCWRLPRRFVRTLRDTGVEVAFFMPVIPWRGRWHANFRNHRKIVVVDGQIGFTGSQNIGDEYLGRRQKYGPWRDTHLRLIGPAAQVLQEVFVEDWHYATGRELVADEYFPPPQSAGEHVVQIVPSGPDGWADVLHQILFTAVAVARRAVCIITPYFVPDAAMMLALRSAASRGVRVQLLIPSRTDNPLVLWAGRSYYEELTAAGIEIYEHDSVMLHSKVVIVDETWATVGSANMDARSFRLNFEITALLYDRALAGELQADFDAQRGAARRIRPTGERPLDIRQSLALGLARLASPLL
jgi:cardiolipin synthase